LLQPVNAADGVESVQPHLGADEVLGRLLGEAQRGPTPVVGEVDTTVFVGLEYGLGRLGVAAAEVQAVGQQHEVCGKPVTADV